MEKLSNLINQSIYRKLYDSTIYNKYNTPFDYTRFQERNDANANGTIT